MAGSPDATDVAFDGPPQFESVPKRSGGNRVLTILCRRDDVEYRSAVRPLVPFIERALGPEAVANRVVPGPGLTLQPWRPAWRVFATAARRVARRGSHVVIADVRECYASIGPGVVERAVLHLGARKEDARRVIGLIDRFGGRHISGLPIGPDPSAVLANAVLVAADQALREHGHPHVRWVDDVWAAAGSRAHAERVLDRLRVELDAWGLELNEEKTQVVEAIDALELGRRRAVSGAE